MGVGEDSGLMLSCGGVLVLDMGLLAESALSRGCVGTGEAAFSLDEWCWHGECWKEKRSGSVGDILSRLK